MVVGGVGSAFGRAGAVQRADQLASAHGEITSTAAEIAAEAVPCIGIEAAWASDAKKAR